MSIAFSIFAFLAVLSAVAVILLKNPIYSAMSLVGTFFCMGAIYVLIGSEFVAAIQVLVYAGAIMVLFLFVLMLLRRTDDLEQLNRGVLAKLVGAGITVGLLAQMIGLFTSKLISYGPKGEYPTELVIEEGSIHTVGKLLYGEYVLPFEVISILLLVAVIGAVVIAKRRLS